MSCPFKHLTKMISKKSNKLKGVHNEIGFNFEHSYNLVIAEETTFEEEFMLQLKMIGLNEEELRFSKKLMIILEPKMDLIVNQFYETILDNPLLKQIIEANSDVDRLKLTLKNHLLDTLNITLNDEYFIRRRKIAASHVKIELASKWYIASFSKLHTLLSDVIVKELHPNDVSFALTVITKLLNLEQQIVLGIYEEELNNKLLNIDKDIKVNIFQSVFNHTQLLSETSNKTARSIETSENSLASITNKAILGSNFAEQAQVQVNTGIETIHLLHNNMNNVVSETERLMEDIHRLSNNSEQMSQIVALVREIADQSNLLSLNASIEAARAGEAGIGFAVVASEMRKLSEHTKQSVDKVNTLISSSLIQSNALAQRVEGIDSIITDVALHVEKTINHFELINGEMINTKTEMNNIRMELESLLSILSTITNLSSTVHETALQLRKKSEELII